MRKTILIMIMACIANIIAYAQVDSTFDISINLQGVTDCKVYITRFYGSGQSINEQTNMKNGELTLAGATSRPFIARVTFSANPRFTKTVTSGGYIPAKCSNLWMAVYPGARFTASGSVEGKDFIDFYPKDGGENDYLAELNSKIMPLINKAVNITLDIDKNKALTAEGKTKLQANEEAFNKQSNEEKMKFIKARPNSLAALWIMEDMLIRSEAKPMDLAPVLAKVDKKKFGTNAFYTAIRDRIEGARSTTVGKKCPDIQTTDTYDGKPFSLASMKGKFILIDFWGTWCGPCMAGVPKMKAFRDKHADKIQILGISNDKSIPTWKSVIEKNQMNWPHILIGKGEKDFVNKFNVQGFPTKILVSPLGIILYRESGENEDFYEKIEKIISK